MGKKRKSDYVPAPEISEEVEARYLAVMEVMSGVTTVTAAAKRLGLSRNRFQTLMHRAQGAMLEALSQKPGGRPKTRTPEEEALAREVARLQKENAELSKQVQIVDRLLGVAGDVVRRQRGRTTKRSSSGTASTTETDDDERRAILLRFAQLHARGCAAEVAALAVGVTAATLRRWKKRTAEGRPLCSRPGPPPRGGRPSEETVVKAERHVEALGGLVGARALSKSFPSLSRRQAAKVKAGVLTKMERVRKEEAMRVSVTVPGAIRGFDAMSLEVSGAREYLLACADGAVPFRTSLLAVHRYDSRAVANTLTRDFETHGAPLVLRLDRASVHRTEEVEAVARRFGVLLLHGPPGLPRYYGQLERQNREHRAWLRAFPDLDPHTLQALLDRMRHALNRLWRRGTLNFRTAEERWNERRPISVHRDALKEEVEQRATRLQSEIDDAHQHLTQRLAIEHALAARGLLRFETGGWC